MVIDLDVIQVIILNKQTYRIIIQRRWYTCSIKQTEFRFDDECPNHARLIPSIILTKLSDGFRDSNFHWIIFGYC